MLSESDHHGVFNLLHEEPDLHEISSSHIQQESTSRGGITAMITDETSFLNKASLWSCYMSLTSTIIGAGILGLPYAFAQTGYLLGSFLLLTCGSFSFLGLHFLSICARKTKAPASFYSVAEATIPKFSYLIDLAVFAKCHGVSISYLIVVGDLMPAAMSQFGSAPMWQSRIPWILIAFGIVAPLSSLQSLDALKWTSSLSVVFILFLVILVILYSLDVSGLDPCEGLIDVNSNAAVEIPCSGPVSLVGTASSALKVLSIFIFGFTCQHNTFAVTNELAIPSQKRLDTVFQYSIGTALVLYFAVALAGYSTYGNLVSADLLKKYPSTCVYLHLFILRLIYHITYLKLLYSFIDIPATSACRIFVSLIVSFHYPLQCHPGRRSALSIWKKVSGSEEPSVNVYRLRYIIVTVIE